MKKDVLEISGITCQACVAKIERKVSRMDGVERANVNLSTGIGSFFYDADKVKLEEIIATIEKLGYGGNIPKKEDRESKKKEKEEQRRKEKREFQSIFFFPVLSFIFLWEVCWDFLFLLYFLWKKILCFLLPYSWYSVFPFYTSEDISTKKD